MIKQTKFWTSTKFAEGIILLVVFLAGFSCGQIVQSSRDKLGTHRVLDAMGIPRDVSFVSVREFDYAKTFLGDDAREDSVVVVKGKVFMPDTLMTRLPQIPEIPDN